MMPLKFPLLCSEHVAVNGCKNFFYITTLCLKKPSNFETVQLEILRTYFDDNWQKYSKVSRIESACFRFHVGLLF